MAYTKPVFGTLSQDSENCGCCFFVTNSGQGAFVYNGDGRPQGGDGEGQPPTSPGVASLGNNNAAVTPLCGTGLPATQPITFGVPVGVSGIRADVPQDGGPSLALDTGALGVSLLGREAALPEIAVLSVPHL